MRGLRLVLFLDGRGGGFGEEIWGGGRGWMDGWIDGFSALHASVDLRRSEGGELRSGDLHYTRLVLRSETWCSQRF